MIILPAEKGRLIEGETEVRHIATIGAFPNKRGNFTGALLVLSTRERVAEDFDTLEEARYWAKVQAHERFPEGRLAPIMVRKSKEYRANVWA